MIGYSLSFVSQIPYLFITRFERIYTYMLIGYARVSTHEQNLDLQRDALKNASCTKTFTDTVSGGTAERPGLARISHTFCDTEAIRSEKVSRCRSLTAAGQADPFRQSVFQPSAGRLMDIG